MKNLEKDLSIDVEKLKAKLDVLIKIKDEMNNRISFLSEKIGELRSSLVDKEKELANFKTSIEKTIKIVEELKPEEILKKFNEFYAKLEFINAKIESSEAILNKIINELKEIRRLYIKFKSFEEIEKIEKEARETLSEIKKSEIKIFSTVSKVESIFSELNRRLEDLIELKKDVSLVKEKSKEFIKDLSELKVLSTSFLRREEISDVEEKIKSILELEKELKKKSENIEILQNVKIVEDMLNKWKEEKEIVFEKLRMIEELLLKVRGLESRIDILNSKEFIEKKEFEKLKNNIMNYLFEIDKIRDELNKRVEVLKSLNQQSLSSRIDELDKKYEELNKNIQEVINLLKTIVGI